MTLAATALRLFAGAALIASTAALAQAPAPTRIRGEIAAVDASTITVKRRGSGDIVKMALKSDVNVGAVRNIDLAAIKKDAFIGTATETGAAMAPNGVDFVNEDNTGRILLALNK